MLKYVYIFFISIQLAFAQENAKSGTASYYHDKFNGRITSSGEAYNKNDFTAAHRTLPFNSILLVTNKKTNQSTVVRINDRGPFKKSRMIDLSQAAAIKTGMILYGVVEVKISLLTYLESFKPDDSIIQNNIIRDCYGNKKKLSDISIFIWETEYLKHAMYMASSLSLEYKIEALIHFSEKKGKRNYIILVSGIKNSKKADEINARFRKAGFSKSAIYMSN